MIESRFVKGALRQDDVYLITASLDAAMRDAIIRGEYAGIGDRIADKIAESLLPDLEHQILSDPKFQTRIINDILIRIANRLSDKGLLEEEITHERAPDPQTEPVEERKPQKPGPLKRKRS